MYQDWMKNIPVIENIDFTTNNCNTVKPEISKE